MTSTMSQRARALLSLSFAFALLLTGNVLHPSVQHLAPLVVSHGLSATAASSVVGAFPWVQAISGVGCGLGIVAGFAGVLVAPGVGALGAAAMYSSVAALCACAFAC